MANNKCPSDLVFQWYLAKIQVLAIEKRTQCLCPDLKAILEKTVKDLEALMCKKAGADQDMCLDPDFEYCDDRCVLVGMCDRNVKKNG